MQIDIQIILLILCITSLLQVLILFIQSRINSAYQGIDWWVAGTFSMLAGNILFLLRDSIPNPFLNILVTNAFILAGPCCIYIGILRFYRKKENLWIILGLVLVYLVSFAVFTYIHEDINGRIFIISLLFAALTAQMSLHLIQERTPHTAGAIDFLIALFIVHSLFFVTRAILTVTILPSTELFDPGLVHAGALTDPRMIQALTFLLYFTSGILTTFGLILLVNQRLNGENRETRENFEAIFRTTPDAVTISQLSDGRVVDVNEGFCRITGYAREEIIGETLFAERFWKGKREQAIQELVKSGYFENMEGDFRRKDGSRFFTLASARIVNLKNKPHIITTIRDISFRKEMEQENQKLLQEKELILQEVHHRIKNNMSTIISMLSIQAKAMDGTLAQTALNDAVGRVRSMMILYERLFVNAQVSDVNSKDYFTRLFHQILESFPESEKLQLETHIDDFTLSARTASPLGIIINELLTNIMKYAFPDDAEGTISLTVQTDGRVVTLSIRDTGKGMQKTNKDREQGFGLMLVDLLTKQINGTMEITANSGTTVTLRFPLR